ncbi:hypothetical protein D3C78_966510 [compost metagenome]
MQGLGAGEQGGRVAGAPGQLARRVPGLLVALILQAPVGGHLLGGTRQPAAGGHARCRREGLGNGGSQGVGHVLGASILRGSL